jgi:hypothetical protein
VPEPSPKGLYEAGWFAKGWPESWALDEAQPSLFLFFFHLKS